MLTDNAARQTRVVLTTNALDPQVTLATGVHAQPGVYALLLGSGVSTGAGLPTGWGVVTDLVRRAAVASAPDDADAAARAAKDPEQWWRDHGDGAPLGYSNLLASLAPTPASRRDLLAGFFEPSDDDLETGVKLPSAAHRAVAALVKKGAIKVILTTNFDRLTERALEDAGVPPQVISRPEAVAGMTPLAHARATVIKLHGDYADLQSRNTVEELSEYPSQWRELLRRVFDEYGLIISGWSGDWDTALVHALQEIPLRRYPLFWDTRSCRGQNATRLLTQHSGHIVPAASADDLFTALQARVEALERLAEAPLSTAITVARLKRYLPDPLRRIDLHDLVTDAAETLAERTVLKPIDDDIHNTLDSAALQRRLAEHLADATPLLELLSTGVRHDRQREHTELWTAVIDRLLRARPTFSGPHFPDLERTRHYPAALALRAAGIAALVAGREDVMLKLAMKPTWRDPDVRQVLPAVQVLHDYATFEGEESVQSLPRWNSTRHRYPYSHILREDLREVLRELVGDDEDYRTWFDAYDYRAALLHQHTADLPGGQPAGIGEYAIGRSRGSFEVPAEAAFRDAAATAADEWPWWAVVGGASGLDGTLLTLREQLKQQRTLR